MPKSIADSLLNPAARKQFEEYLAARVSTIRTQMQSSFITKREIYEKQMQDDFSWRGAGGSGRDSRIIDDLTRTSIFDLQNDSVNVVGATAEFMAARGTDDIFGSEPYFAVNPEGIEDEELAADIQKHAEWKLRQTKFKSAGIDAIDLAFGLGEGVLKLFWEVELDVYETSSTVMHVGGKPFITEAKEHLTEDDMTPDETGGLTSAKAPGMAFAAADFREIAIEKTNVTFSGLKVEPMHYKDFLCPLTAACVDEADFVGHRFQMLLSEAKVKFAMAPELVEELTPESDEPKSEKDRPRDDETLEVLTSQLPNPMIEFVECWVKHDPVGDGRARRLYVVIAMPLGRIVEMDYIANRTPNGKLPFKVVRAYPVKHRWYGRGYFEIFANAQDFIDRQLNRIEFRNQMHSNPVTFVDHSLLVEEEDAEDFELVPGKTFRKRDGSKMEDIIEAFALPDLDERTWDLKQFAISMLQVRSGVTSAAQGDVSSLPSTATATGTESILQSGSVLARLPINTLRDELAEALLYGVELIYANFDRDETYTYFEGEVQRAQTLEAARVANLRFNVRLLMTRMKTRESLESAKTAIDIINGYIATPEPEKPAVRPLYIQAIKGAGFEHADTVVRQPIPMAPGAMAPVEGELPANVEPMQPAAS